MLATGLNKTLLPTMTLAKSLVEYSYVMKLTYQEYPDNTLVSTVTSLIILDINMTSSAANTVPGADMAITCAAYDAALVQSYTWFKNGKEYTGDAKTGATYNKEKSRSEILIEYLGVTETDAGEYYCSVIFHSFSLALSAKDSTGLQKTTLSVMTIRKQPEEVTFISPGYVSFITCTSLWPAGVTDPIITWTSSTGIKYITEAENVTNSAKELNDVRYIQTVFQTPIPSPSAGTKYIMNITYIEIHGPGAIISEVSEIKLRTAKIPKITLNSAGYSSRTFPAFLGSELKISCKASSNAIVPKESIKLVHLYYADSLTANIVIIIKYYCYCNKYYYLFHPSYR